MLFGRSLVFADSRLTAVKPVWAGGAGNEYPFAQTEAVPSGISRASNQGGC